MPEIKKNADILFFGAAYCALIVGFCLYYVKLAGITGLIIIHFTGGVGADFLDGAPNALAMLFTGTVITTINACIAGILYSRNNVLMRITGILTLIMALLIVIAVSCIITVN